jgi:hypothetical protein
MTDDRDLGREYPVVAVKELRDEEADDTCRNRECEHTASYRVARAGSATHSITVGYCRTHLPQPALAPDGSVRTFGEVHEPDGPDVGALAKQYLLTIQRRDQREAELQEDVLDLRRAGHLSAAEADLAERSLDAGTHEEFLDVLEVGLSCEAEAERDGGKDR